MTSKQYTKTVEHDTLDSDVEELLGSYRAEPKPMVHITYKSPNFGKQPNVSSMFEKVREKDLDVERSIAEYKKIDREIIRTIGYEDVPTLLRGIESVRRYAMSRITNGEKDIETIVRLGLRAADHLEDTVNRHETAIPNYERAEEQLTSYKHSLEDHLIDIADTKMDAETRLTTLKSAMRSFRDQAPRDGSIKEKVLWKRSYEAMEKDYRKLESLNLRTTQDMNQTDSLIKTAKAAEQVLDIGRTMNEVASIQARSLVGQLRMNIELYKTNAAATDLANDVGRQLASAARLTDMLSKGTHSRMSALNDIIGEFALPSGKGANSIAGGGIVNGLKSHLEEMQRFGDEELESRMDDFLP